MLAFISLLVCAILLYLCTKTYFPRPKIKCNINAKGEQIYHLPTDRLYGAVTIKYIHKF